MTISKLRRALKNKVKRHSPIRFKRLIDILRTTSCQRHQYALPVGRIIELSIHELTLTIKKALKEQEIALGALLSNNKRIGSTL